MSYRGTGPIGESVGSMQMGERMPKGSWAMRALPVALGVLCLGALCLAAPAAQARWYGGVVIGVPAYPPPVYYAPPPPVYVAPPPVYVTPPPVYVAPGPVGQAAPPPPGASCRAGTWVCPLDRPTPVGDSCACPTAGGSVWGRAQ